MTAICVLGMHRSGTSTITRGLNLLGAYLGDDCDIVKPLPENPEGFWERYDIYYLQERMLSVLKREWATTTLLPQNWYTFTEIRPLRDELVEVVRKNFLGQPLWLWKDPRSCLFLPIWKDVLSELGVDLQIVFVVRNPLDVARSLEKRNGFTVDKGLGIWFNYTLSAIRNIEGLNTVYLSYDRFLDDWEAELKKCVSSLGIRWPDDEACLRSKMSAFVRQDLRHSASGLHELQAVNAPEPVIRLYQFVLELLSGKCSLEPSSRDDFKEIYREFENYTRLFDFDMVALADCRLMLENAVRSPEALPVVIELRKELETRTHWAWKLGEEVKMLREEVTSLENSLSWKITRPLRSVHGRVLKLLQGQ